MARLRACIDDDHPVMVPVDNDHHWSVVYGYGDDAIYLMDPSLKSFAYGGKRTTEDFLDRWDRWGIEISDPALEDPPARPIVKRAPAKK